MLPQTQTYNITAQCIRSRPTYRSSHTCSQQIQIKPYIFHTHTDQGIQSLIHMQSKAQILLHIHTGQNIQTPHTYRAMHKISTYIQSKAYNIPHTYRARHTIFHIHTGQSILSTTRILLQTCCHKHVSQDIPLPTDACYQSYSSRHTISYGHLPADIVLPYTALVHMYRPLDRHGHPRTQQHRYHSKAACHGRQDYQHHNG